MKKMRSPNKEAGMTLIETMLVIGLLSGVLLILTVLLQDFIRREHMRGVASQMAIVQKAVSETVRSASMFSALYQYVADNGGVAEISILALDNPARALSSGYTVTGAVSLERGGNNILPSTIVNAGYQAGGGPNHSGFRDTLPIRAASYLEEYGSANNVRRNARLSILARTVERNGERALEILIVSVDRIAERDLRDISAAMDAHGGLISARPSAEENDCHELGCAYTARGALGNWRLNMPDFSGTRWYNNVMTANLANYDQDAGTGEGYLASYTYVSEAVIAGDYLYRVAVPGSPQLNRMHARLDLGNNDVLGADNVEIRNREGTALTVNNTVHAQGSAYIAGDLLVQGDLDVRGTMRAGDLTVQPVADGGVAPGMSRNIGNVVVGNRFKTQDLTTGGSVSVANDATLLGATAGNVAGQLLTTTNLAAEESSVLTGVLANPNNINASGLVQSGQISTTTVQAQSVGIVQGDVNSNLTVGGALNAAGGKIQVQGGTNISNLTRCERGC